MTTMLHRSHRRPSRIARRCVARHSAGNLERALLATLAIVLALGLGHVVTNQVATHLAAAPAKLAMARL